MTTLAQGIAILIRHARDRRVRDARAQFDRLEPSPVPRAPRLRLVPRPVPSVSSTLTWPTAGTVSSRFGPRLHPVLHVVRPHDGLDIRAAVGTPVWAADRGTVVFAGWRGGYGRMVIIDHGGGLQTRYAHMSSIDVSVGAEVAARQTIGAVGQTGMATGPHLHFETRRNGQAVDPVSVVEGRHGDR
ncbi:MAG: M23 family metallopeptidase [Casimicrobiaceae bacterium]